MASEEAETSRLRSRAENVLSSPACRAVRFRLDNVAIQTFMYSTIANAIREDRVHMRIGRSRHYDHLTNTIWLDTADVPPYVIVHEATHAVLDATHVGQNITVGTHEAAAYLAETVYALNAGDSTHV